MNKATPLSINPNKTRIYKHFPFFLDLDDKTNNKINAWNKIDKADFDFLTDVFTKRKMKIDLNDVSFIFNYFMFLFDVSKTKFHEECDLLDKMVKELWPLIDEINNKKPLLQVSFQTKDYPNIKIVSDPALKSLEKILKDAFYEEPFWQTTFIYLKYLKETNELDSFLKKKPGNKINCTETVIKQSATLFKKYLIDNCVREDKKYTSYHSVIGEIFEYIGLIEPLNENLIRKKSEYYITKAQYLDLDLVAKRTSNTMNDLFPPHFLIILNETLI